MHPRNPPRVIAHVALLSFVSLWACAVTPPSRTETPSIRQIRAEYFRAFPDGQFNDRIERGQVVKGMSLFEVLAAWGIPDARTVKVEENRECWVYVLVDDTNLDWVRYDFTFHGNELTGWEMTPNIASGATLEVPEHPGVSPLPSWATTTSGTGAPVR
jgi:hypothetical protein